MQDLVNKAEVPAELVPYNNELASIKAGQNILLKVNGAYFLMKYEAHDTEIENHETHRLHRNVTYATFEWLYAETEEKRQKARAARHREWKRYKGNIYGTHQIKFSFDEEFQIFLPSSSNRDLFLTLAWETKDGEIIPREGVIEIIVDDDLITEALQEVVRPLYFETVILPFLESRYTAYEIPKWNRTFFVNKSILEYRFWKKTRHLDRGAFVYVGCKEEVYLLGLARVGSNELYMQGTYSTSTKPLLYFSNNYLQLISRSDAESRCDIPGFGGKPFIFPQMGRTQDCKNTIFTGEPHVITDDIGEAAAHFITTDFAEYVDVVRKYADRVTKIHPSTADPRGRFYY